MILHFKGLATGLVICLLTACANSVIETAPWNNTPVPVVYSIISPNEPVQVYLFRTYNKDIPAVKNPYPEAKVYVCGPDSLWKEITRLSPDTSLFKDTLKQLIIEQGKTYSLKVLLSGTTVHAQTSIPEKQGSINNVSCEMLKSYEDSNRSLYLNGVLVNASTNHLKFSIILGSDARSGYFFRTSYDALTDYSLLFDSTYQTSEFGVPQDSSSFTLNLMTADTYLSKYLKAQFINTASNNYGGNSPVLALIQSFGGVIPQFSNIVNGVGVFGNAVYGRKRVTIKPIAK